MKHYSYEQWTAYVKNELEEQVREVYEDHLYSCDQCLEIYLQAVEIFEPALPAITDANSFTNSIMAQISETKEKKHEIKLPFYQKTIFHYTLAAVMTILFMTSGVFKSITNYVDNVQSPYLEERSPTVTEGLVNKTFAWMDTIKNEEAKK